MGRFCLMTAFSYQRSAFSRTAPRAASFLRAASAYSAALRHLSFFLHTFLLSGLFCGAAGAQTPASSTQPNALAAREVTDGAGRTVKVPLRIERIVSLAPSMTEVAFALGAGARVVGVTDYCDYPPEASAIAKVGGALSPSLERIVELKPGVVLATSTLNRRETVDALDRLGVPVFGARDPRTVDEVLDSIAAVADVLGETERGATLVAGLRARLAALAQRLSGLPPRRVLFVVWHDPLITVGRGTFIADALRHAGSRSVIEVDQDWPRISLEEVVRLDPEVIVFASSHSETVTQTFDALAGRPGWRNITAVRERRYAVIGDAVNRPAPRLVDAMEELARQLHPAAFQDQGETRNATLETRLLSNCARAPSRGTIEVPAPNLEFPEDL
jgi:iron complex transport system substrate-binding protein